MLKFYEVTGVPAAEEDVDRAVGFVVSETATFPAIVSCISHLATWVRHLKRSVQTLRLRARDLERANKDLVEREGRQYLKAVRAEASVRLFKGLRFADAHDHAVALNALIDSRSKLDRCHDAREYAIVRYRLNLRAAADLGRAVLASSCSRQLSKSQLEHRLEYLVAILDKARKDA